MRRKARRYVSPIRTAAAEQTRARILEAARELFVERGFAAMTMQEVAERAEVALDTVYATVGKKPMLVELLVETAISNTDQAVPAEQREYVQRIKQEPSAHGKLALYARAVADIHPRLAPLVRAVQEASRAHPELGAIWKRIAERRAKNMKLLAAELVATGEVRKELTVDRIADVLWATNSPELYLLLVEQRGWTAAEFATWLADAWQRLLLA